MVEVCGGGEVWWRCVEVEECKVRECGGKGVWKCVEGRSVVKVCGGGGV